MKNEIIIGGIATVLVVASGVGNVMMIQRMAEVEQKSLNISYHHDPKMEG